ncbi:hypothetical protein F4813DRAFT_364204 [Daldinia decipiens]|uniref:uncharacterized protein n=1 Tax=Daldinia decipiens TaxID=326647 RepID=UPI0020C488BF|nr:uncharacterized protein F4813DRAFT_364204 [Daldinia decipiens]KAI1656384.1 hypothetical protein F4813DRAFT_364204 [Daldinia decipiens]
MPHLRSSLVWACLGASFARAQEVVYVTDLSIFTVLAPCAAAAVSENVQAQTYQNCPEAVTDLQSCVCTKNNNFASISTGISSSVSRSCGSTASEDQASAASVFNAYCNQASITPFPTPSNPVTQYITDFAAWQDLAPCAASGLSYVVQSMTYDLCPAEPSLLATCVCNKNQNSLLASQGINKSVKSSCSSHVEDIDSAQAVFSGYCGLIKGTSSFPTTSDPPGDMTYYITALPEYSSLAPCAQSAVSYGVLSQTYDLCPDGPKALASCACLKSSMSGSMRNVITSDVKYSCDSTATEDVSSALLVFDLYCSAAKGLTTPAGVTESLEQTMATSNTGTSGPKETGISGGSGSLSSEGGGRPLESGVSSSDSANKSNTGTIVGVVVGVLAALALIGLAIFFFWRQRRHSQNGSQTMSQPVDSEYSGKPELDGSQNPDVLKTQEVTRVDNVSPVSAYSSPNTSELQGHGGYPQPPIPQIPELRGQNHASQMPSPISPYTPQEAHGQPVHEAPAQTEPRVYEAHGQPRSELEGMGWQSGPVTGLHEVDGGYKGQ